MFASQKLPRAFVNVAAWTLGITALLWATVVRAGGDENQIRSLSHHTLTRSTKDQAGVPGTTTIRIAGTRTPTFTVYKLERPLRVVIDIAGAALTPDIAGNEGKATWSIGSWSVGQISAHPIDGTIVRVSVGLARPGTYKVRADGHDVLVTVTPRDPAPLTVGAAEAAKAVAEARAEAEQAKQAAEAAKAQAEKAAREAKEQAQATVVELERVARSTREEADRARRDAKTSEADAERARQAAAQAKSEADEANRALAKARAEMERVRRSQAASKTEIDQARQAAEAAKAEADALRAAAAKREAEALRAREQAAQRQTDAERTRKAAEAAIVEVEQARAAAAQAKAEAERMKQIAEAARADAEKSRQLAAMSQAEVARMKQETAQTKEEVARTREEAARTREEAAQVKQAAQEALKEATLARQKAQAEAEASRRRAQEESERAEKAILQARAEVETARARAEERVREADARMAAAEELMKSAEHQLTAAKRAEKDAKAAQRSADEAKKRALEREQEVASAERRAKEREAEAARAEAAAQKYRAEAASMRSDDTRAVALQKRAEEAAKAAEKRRAEAEAATQAAERSRREAEQAAGAAEARQREAQAAARQAETQRAEAEKAKTEAESRRAEVETQRQQAEKRRAEAEVAAREAAERAERARELRVREEAAYAKIVEARTHAEERAQAASEAGARLADARRAVSEAEATAESKRQAAAEAKRLVAELARRKDASKQEITRLEAEASRLAGERDRADKEASMRRKEAATYKQEVAKLEQAREKTTAELKELKAEAAKVRAAREREEARLAELTRLRAEAERARASAEEKARLATARAQAGTSAAAATTTSPAPASKNATVRVRDLHFEDTKQAARVVIQLSGEAGKAGQAEPRVVSSEGKRAILEITGAELPTALQRTLDTSRYQGPIKTISSYRDPRDPSITRVIVDLHKPVKSALKRAGTDYYWDFAKPRQADPVATKAGGKAEAQGQARARSLPPVVVGGYGASSTPITQKSIAQLTPRNRKVYRGTKIDLDFKDADIHNLLRLLADVGGVNIVIPDEIQARVTVRMRRVPWDQALEVILASKGLWYRREGNLYRIAPRKQLDAEDEAEAERRANMVKAEAPEPEIFTLNYAVAKDVKPQLEPLLSPKGRIQVDDRTNSLIINDIRAHRRRIIELLTRLDTQTPQVQIEARIVEARSSFSREIGVQWGGSALATREGGNSTGLLFPNSVAVRGGNEDQNTINTGVAVPSDFAVNLPAAVGSGAGGAIGISLGSVGGNFNLNLRLSALEDTGSVRIISAPKITVLNNVRAEISQGVSIPISVISANGVQTQFVPADLSLKVTPHVSQRDCAIQMELEVSKNEADFANTGARGDPSILRKEAKTTILVSDGETTVIGGIYTRNTGLSYSKVPFFGDLPVIGWFFKNRRENDERTEVLVFITPKITNKAFLRCQ